MKNFIHGIATALALAFSTFTSSAANVPEGPGLGYEVDEAELRRMSRQAPVERPPHVGQVYEEVQREGIVRRVGARM